MTEGNYHSWINWNHWASMGVLIRWLSWFRMLNCWWAASPRSQQLGRFGMVLVTPGICQAYTSKFFKADSRAISQRSALINGSLEQPVLMAKNHHHVTEVHHKFGVTNQMWPCLKCYNKGQQFQMGDDVSLLGDKLWEWSVEVITFAQPFSSYQSGIRVNKSTWLKQHIKVDWLGAI